MTDPTLTCPDCGWEGTHDETEWKQFGYCDIEQCPTDDCFHAFGGGV